MTLSGLQGPSVSPQGTSWSLALHRDSYPWHRLQSNETDGNAPYPYFLRENTTMSISRASTP